MAKKRSNRGGYRKPSKPAAVSGPGALSKRTDGKQPVVRMPDVAHGEQKALTEQQQAAPLGGAPNAAAGQAANIFAPTNRPGEPLTEGAPIGPGRGSVNQLQNDKNVLLQAMDAINPHPLIAELINTDSQ